MIYTVALSHLCALNKHLKELILRCFQEIFSYARALYSNIPAVMYNFYCSKATKFALTIER
jgi:hypothetical protein